MEDVELLDQKLYARLDQMVGDVVAVYLGDGWHDKKVATAVEDTFKLLCGIDNGSHGIAKNT